MRRHSASRRARTLLRGWSIATLCVAAGTASHAVVSGHVPGAAAVAVAWALTGLLCVLLAGRGLSRLPVAAGVLAAQAALHWLMDRSAPLPQTAPTGGHAGHGVGLDSLAGASLEAAPAPVHATDPGMVAGHLAAGLLTYAAIRRGEAALTALSRSLRLAARWLCVPRLRPLPARALRPLPVPAALPAPRRVLLPGTAPVRGPPLVLA
ncbi:hypothetical protein [Rothia halotolerans]|uniref:hypothetical protein n=1 Tax=Rothia halotolerans TaxID=405770 RepID=UPI00101D3393|nr:hypothetical protein [Rothia halotolerans]